MSRLDTSKGKMREPCRISIGLTTVGVEVSLSDYNTSHSIRAEAERLSDAFSALERILTAPRPPWRRVKRGELYNKRKSEDSKKA